MSMDHLAARRARLSPEQRALLDRWSLGRFLGTNGAEVSAIPRRPPSGTAVLSFAQQRLWFLDQLEPGNPFYSMDFAWRLRMPIDVGALGWAVDRIVARHEVLRTRFVANGTSAVQDLLERVRVLVDV